MTPLGVDKEEGEGEEGGEGDEEGELVDAHRLDHFESGVCVALSDLFACLLAPLVVLGRAPLGHGAVWETVVRQPEPRKESVEVNSLAFS